mmetsp:Transcript_49325/g.104917  ORF Transcript_49325/g.104917 Transcript_49325/m.104917 type:complete len:735 (-) Transcript_49325:268-2472(-)
MESLPPLDVGLGPRSSLASSTAVASQSSQSLRCGRLLLFLGTHEEYSALSLGCRPWKVLDLAGPPATHADLAAKLPPNEQTQVAYFSLPDPGDDDKRSQKQWLRQVVQQLVAVTTELQDADVGQPHAPPSHWPVMLMARGEAGCQRAVAAVLQVVLLLLSLAGIGDVPNVKHCTSYANFWLAAEEGTAAIVDGIEQQLRKLLGYIKKAGGANEYLDLEDSTKLSLLGGNDAEETQWLKGLTEALCKGARRIEKAGQEAASLEWRKEAAAAAAMLARRSALAEAPAALYYRGWALSALPDYEAQAAEALSLGLKLGQLGGVKQQVLDKLEKELGTLRAAAYERSVDGMEEVEVLELSKASDHPGDPHSTCIILATSEPGESGKMESSIWQALPCPKAFSWLRCGELAGSITPKVQHFPALKSLSLTKLVSADLIGAAASENPLDHFEAAVKEVAAALSAGDGCLVHCSDGFGATGIVLACFAVVHGLDDPVRAKPGQPKMTAGEALEVLRALRPGVLASPGDEELVQNFAQNAWAAHIQAAQRAFCRPLASSSSSKSITASSTAASTTASSTAESGTASTKPPAKSDAGLAPEPSRPLAPSTAKVVRQPGDGNCLFHSMAYGLGSCNASALRTQICAFMESHPSLLIAGTPLSEWIQMLAGSEVHTYAKKMAKGAQWGGAPEIACCAHLKKVNIHVYEQRRKAEYELTVPFDIPGSTKTVNVLYVGGVHYDALAF